MRSCAASVTWRWLPACSRGRSAGATGSRRWPGRLAELLGRRWRCSARVVALLGAPDLAAPGPCEEVRLPGLQALLGPPVTVCAAPRAKPWTVNLTDDRDRAAPAPVLAAPLPAGHRAGSAAHWPRLHGRLVGRASGARGACAKTCWAARWRIRWPAASRYMPSTEAAASGSRTGETVHIVAAGSSYEVRAKRLALTAASERQVGGVRTEANPWW